MVGGPSSGVSFPQSVKTTLSSDTAFVLLDPSSQQRVVPLSLPESPVPMLPTRWAKQRGDLPFQSPMQTAVRSQHSRSKGRFLQGHVAQVVLDRCSVPPRPKEHSTLPLMMVTYSSQLSNEGSPAIKEKS